MPSEAAEGLVKGCEWHGMQEVSRDRYSPWLAASTSSVPSSGSVVDVVRAAVGRHARVIDAVKHVDLVDGCIS